MFNVNNGDITVTKGDSGRIQAVYKNAVTNEKYDLQSGDILVFTIRKVNTDTVVLQKVTSGSDVIRIFSTETESLSIGKYTYTVQLQTVDDEVSTIGPYSFEVVKGFVYHSAS